MEGLLGQFQRDAVLGSFGTREARLHRSQVEFQGVCENGVGRRFAAEESLIFAVGFNQFNPLRITTRKGEIFEGFIVHGAEIARSQGGHCRELRTHPPKQFDRHGDFTITIQTRGDRPKHRAQWR